MHQSLNIPLTAPATTRRDSRRVVALVSGIVFGACIGLFVFRIPFTLSRTATVSPADAATVRILKTDDSVDTLSTHMGNLAIFPGAPWTINSLLQHSRREITVSFLPNGEMAYIVDAILPEKMLQTASAFGLQAVVDGNATAISPTGVQMQKAGYRVIPSGILPWHKGEVWDGNRKGAVSLSEKGITLRHLGIAVETAHPTVPEGTTATAYLTTIASGLQIPSAFRSLLSSPVGDVLDLFSENGGSLLLTEDHTGTGYVLTTASGDMSSEELAIIGKDIMNRSSLSTLPWTLEDGTTYEEIIGPDSDLNVEIRAEEDFTYVSLKDTEGNIIRMTKTPDQLTIANREINVLQGSRVDSTCLRSAHSWVQTRMFGQQLLMTTTTEDAFQEFIRAFEEVAISNGKIRLCW